MTSFGNLRVGDEVRVLDTNGRRVGQPDGGWIGRVEKVGRTLVTVSYPGCRPAEGEKFSMSDGYHPNDPYRHRHIHTADEIERQARRAAAIGVLREHHIELKLGRDRSFTIEQLEALAEVVKTWDREAGQWPPTA
jgi:hypothetical protein